MTYKTKLAACGAALLLFAACLAGQNAALMPVPKIQYFDQNGIPLAGGFVYTCTAGSTCSASTLGGPPSNPLATYTDSTGGTPLPNPVVLDAGGFASIWLGTAAYKIVVQSALGVAISTTDNVQNNGLGVSALKCAASGVACLDASSHVLQSELNYNLGGTGSVNRPIQNRLQDFVSLKDFPVDPTGVADSTTGITLAVAAVASAGGTVLVPAGTYKTTSTITLPNGVNLIALDNGGGAYGHTAIGGSFAGAVLNISGTFGGNLVEGITINNSYWGGSQGIASAITNTAITGPVVLRNLEINVKDTGILSSGQLISWSIENVWIVGDSGSNGLSRCISANGRNSRFQGGRVYGCHIAYDIAGNDWKLDSVDGEFDDIVIRTQPAAGMLVTNSHFETSGMLWTNATNLPTTTTYPWTDNGGNGIGWSGTFRFINNTVFLLAHGAANAQGAPLFVVKSQPSMSGRLVLDGNDFVVAGTSISPNFYSLSSSFDYTMAPALVTGVQVISSDTINIPTIPTDAFTSWLDLSYNGSTQYGNYNKAGAITINGNGGIALNGTGGIALTTGGITLNGVPFKPPYAATTSTIGGSSLAAGACSTGTVSIAAANAASTVMVSPNFYDPGPNFLVRAGVSGNGPTVNVYVCAITSGTPGAQTYNVRLIP
jgi:hypothetical protein